MDKWYIPVTEEVYKEYYRPIWRTHYRARKHERCGCTDWRWCVEGSKSTLMETIEDSEANIAGNIRTKGVLECKCSKNPHYDAVNALQAGIDSEGGYLVSYEF